MKIEASLLGIIISEGKSLARRETVARERRSQTAVSDSFQTALWDSSQTAVSDSFQAALWDSSQTAVWGSSQAAVSDRDRKSVV